MKLLKQKNWEALMFHQSKTARTEIAEAVVKQLSEHLDWLQVGIDKVPDPYITNALSEKKITLLIEKIINDWPRTYRLNELDNLIRRRITEIEKLKQSAHSQNKGKIKSLKRSLTLEQDQYDKLRFSVDQRRIDLALFMVEKGARYIIEKNLEYMDDRVEQSQKFADVDKTLNDLRSMAKDIPFQKHMRQAKIDFFRKQQEEKNQAAQNSPIS